MTLLCRHLSPTAQEIVNWVTTADRCVHTADATQLDSRVPSASAVCIGLYTSKCATMTVTELWPYSLAWAKVTLHKMDLCSTLRFFRLLAYIIQTFIQKAKIIILQYVVPHLLFIESAIDVSHPPHAWNFHTLVTLAYCQFAWMLHACRKPGQLSANVQHDAVHVL